MSSKLHFIITFKEKKNKDFLWKHFVIEWEKSSRFWCSISMNFPSLHDNIGPFDTISYTDFPHFRAKISVLLAHWW